MWGRDLGGIGQQADAEDVDPRRGPDQAGQEQQGVLFQLASEKLLF